MNSATWLHKMLFEGAAVDGVHVRGWIRVTMNRVLYTLAPRFGIFLLPGIDLMRSMCNFQGKNDSANPSVGIKSTFDWQGPMEGSLVL